MRITALTLETTVRSVTGAVELVFTPKRPVPFRAGQGGLLVVPGGGARPFTLAGDDGGEQVSIATTLASGSRFKRALGSLLPGDRARLVGPVGTLPTVAAGESCVLVAQGIGITPFLSAARSRGHLDATLLQVGTPHYFDETASAMATAEHHEHREALAEAVRRATVDRPTARWFLSGRPEFVTAVATQLRAAGVGSRLVHRDTFWGMRAPASRTTSTSTTETHAVAGLLPQA